MGLNSAKEHEIQSSEQLKQFLNGGEKLFTYKNIKLIEKVSSLLTRKDDLRRRAIHLLR